MRILAVRGANLTSLDGPFAIDFDREPLRRAGLFAITGPTGAGKSTILDALCLALFDSMPRLPEGRGEMLGPEGDPNSIRTTDVRTILRRGAGSGWAEVDFIGIDGEAYRARWEVRRARQKAQGALQQQSMSLSSLDGERRFGDGKKTVLEEIEQRLGLSFEQFRRAVLLAQGDFATFLKAPPRERSALLELLTGTEIYSRLSVAAHERSTAEKQALDRLVAQGGGIGVLSDDDRTALQAEAGEAAEAVRSGEQALALAQAALAWHERDSQLAAAESKAVAAAETTERAWSDAEERRNAALALRGLQPLRPMQADADRARDEAAEAAAAVERAETALATARLAVDEATGRHGEARRRFEAACAEQARAEPELDRASDLDGRIATLTGEQGTADAVVKAAVQRSIALRKALQDIDATLSSARSDAARLEVWLREQAGFAAVAGQWERWDRLLGRIVADGRSGKAAAQERQQLERELAATEAAARTVEGRLAEARDRCRSAEQALESLRGIAVPSLEEARHARSEAGQRRDGLLALLATGEALRRLEAERTAADGERLRLLDEAERDGTSAQELAESRAGRQAAVDEAERTLQRLLLAQREDVESLRGRLVEGEPCPVCGSADHPWAGAGATPLGRVTRDQETHLAELREAQAATVARHAALEAAELAARKGAEALTARLAAMAREADGLEARWAAQAAAVDWDAGGGTLTDIHADIRGQVDAVDRRMAAIAQDEEQALDHRRRLDAAQLEHRRLETAAAGLASECEATRQRLAEGRQALALAAAALERAEADRNAALAELADGLAGEAGWQALLERDPEGYRAALARRVSDYREKSDGLARAAREVERASGERAVQSAELEAAQRAEDEARNRAADLAGRLAEARTARGAVLDGRPVSQVRTTLAAQKHEAEALVEKATFARQDAIARLSAAEQERESRGEAARRCTAKARTAGERLDSAVAERGVELEEVRRLLAAPESELEAEELALAVLERARGDAALVVAERRRQRGDHHAAGRPAQSVEDAGAAAESIRAVLERDRDRLGSARGRLEADDANRQRLAGLMAAIEAQQARCALWGKMAQLIGSSTGQKMRNFAQSLSLDLLLTHANRHLEDLARRYRLERVAGADLEIQVVDREMGDERRGVHSLSGGELFLVSLALALGLSAMAAGTSGGIGTLFIDEGFGTLDPDSLDVALSCLEALQAGGRQVGVISHVPAMVERIGTQIRVLPLGGGCSRVTVQSVAGTTLGLGLALEEVEGV
ncbi:AAA family ATPase [Azospirillum melinis]|uniref:AAA family ATPase n=1 Tax=Azospirillum melinis TaxID=328839 RepID=A0ABX2KP79_9PROT|nr:AAA family ATPase [Azospirillum melinis]MBP2307282.1 exonuclease SbcC [Azospirillum melinis]NUB04506.1 AAA family ATPase [Azospirillum melinis]